MFTNFNIGLVKFVVITYSVILSDNIVNGSKFFKCCNSILLQPLMYLSIKLHSFVCYSLINVHRTADTLKNYLSAILWTLIGLEHTKECSSMLLFIFLNYFKPISFLNIVFFVQILTCKFIQWKQDRLFHVSCVC